MPFIVGLSALTETFGIQKIINTWFNHSSFHEFQLSSILTLIESSTSNVALDDFIIIMNVLSIFAFQMQLSATKSLTNVQQLATTDGNLELRILIVFLRVLNLYYTIYVENRVRQQASSSSVFSSDSPSKQTENKTNDISYLVGTGIYQMKSANYNECPVLKSLEFVVQGSYKNFMVNHSSTFFKNYNFSGNFGC